MWKALIFFKKLNYLTGNYPVFTINLTESFYLNSYQLYDAVLTLLFIADVVPEKRGT